MALAVPLQSKLAAHVYGAVVVQYEQLLRSVPEAGQTYPVVGQVFVDTPVQA